MEKVFNINHSQHNLKNKLKMMIDLLDQGLEDKETIKLNIDGYIDTYYNEIKEQLKAQQEKLEVAREGFKDIINHDGKGGYFYQIAINKATKTLKTLCP